MRCEGKIQFNVQIFSEIKFEICDVFNKNWQIFGSSTRREIEQKIYHYTQQKNWQVLLCPHSGNSRNLISSVDYVVEGAKNLMLMIHYLVIH
jgi:hypothetical protein